MHFRADRIAHACPDVHTHHVADERSVAHANCHADEQADNCPHQRTDLRAQQSAAPGADLGTVPDDCAHTGPDADDEHDRTRLFGGRLRRHGLR